MSDTDVLETIEFLQEQYNQEPNDNQLDFWIEALGSYDPDTLRRAAVNCVKSQKWYPKLSEFIGMVEKANEPIERRQIYWRAMSLYNMNLKGQITDEQLDRDAAWGYWRNEGIVVAPSLVD